MDIAFLWSTLLAILPGVPTTLKLTAVSVFIGLFLALALAAMRLSGHPLLVLPARAYVFVFRGTPLLVQIYLIYYGLAQFSVVRESLLWPFLREAYWCAILALTLNTGAYASEIVRGGLQSVPFGQIEAARAAGMSRLVMFRRIVAPLAIRQALPGYSNELILMIKSTSLASIITIFEISGLAYKVASETYRYIEVFFVAGLIYLSLNFAITRAIQALEHWLSPHLRPAPATPLLNELKAV